MTKTPDPALAGIVRSGKATDVQLEQFFGADLINQLAGQWAPPEAYHREFRRWHQAVTSVLGVPETEAEDLFYGRITIEQFVDRLPDDILKAFDEHFARLQNDFVESQTAEGLLP